MNNENHLDHNLRVMRPWLAAMRLGLVGELERADEAYYNRAYRTIPDALTSHDEMCEVSDTLTCGGHPLEVQRVFLACRPKPMTSDEDVIIFERQDTPALSFYTSDEPVYRGFSYPQLKAAFDKLADPSDWRAPIYAVMPGELVSVAVAAIQFFTATEPDVQLDMQHMKYHVQSIGYRAGPAGDH